MNSDVIIIDNNIGNLLEDRVPLGVSCLRSTCKIFRSKAQTRLRLGDLGHSWWLTISNTKLCWRGRGR